MEWSMDAGREARMHSAFFSWGKCSKMERLLAVTSSITMAFSWNIDMFMASQTPQLIMKGSSFKFLWEASSSHDSHVDYSGGPFHSHCCLRSRAMSLQTFLVKGHVMRMWSIVSVSPLHKIHQPGPSIWHFLILSQVGTLLNNVVHMKRLDFSGALSFQSPVHH